MLQIFKNSIDCFERIVIPKLDLFIGRKTLYLQLLHTDVEASFQGATTIPYSNCRSFLTLQVKSAVMEAKSSRGAGTDAKDKCQLIRLRTKNELEKNQKGDFTLLGNRGQIETFKSKSRWGLVGKNCNIAKRCCNNIGHSVEEAIKPKLISESRDIPSSGPAVKDKTNRTQMAMLTKTDLKL